MKNVTITLDERLIEAARKLPEVQKASLSAFIANLLKRELDEPNVTLGDQLVACLKAASAEATPGWKWNREEIYED